MTRIENFTDLTGRIAVVMGATSGLGRSGRRRQNDGLAGHSERVQHRHHLLEHSGHEPRAGAYGIRFRYSARRPGIERGWEFSSGYQNGSRMVPEERARPCHRHLQLWLERRGHRRTTRRAVDCEQLRLAGAFIITGALGFVWLVFWITLYRKPEEHPRVSRAELAYIQSDPLPSANDKLKFIGQLER